MGLILESYRMDRQSRKNGKVGPPITSLSGGLVQMKSAVTTSATRFSRREQAAAAARNNSQLRRWNWRLILAIGLSLALWSALILGAIKLIG
jgi:hypothetical protein